MTAGFPLVPLDWCPTYRVIPSRFPPIDLFERVTDPADLDAVVALEGLTNPRLRQEIGDISLLPPDERISGPGTSAIMAAFTHVNPNGSRFSKGHYGVYYAARSLGTAIRETVYHREKFLAATREAVTTIDMRVYLADLVGKPLHDLRGVVEPRGIYSPDDYSVGHMVGHSLRQQNSWGLVYDSVRDAGGACVGIFRPRALAPARQGAHLSYVWDGTSIVEVYEKRPLVGI